MSHYHSTNDCFPLGVSASNNPITGYIAWTGWSAHALMLNFIEQGPLYNSLNFSFDPTTGDNSVVSINTTVVQTTINGFICPSDPVTNARTLVGQFNNNYYGSEGTSTIVEQQASPTTGMFASQLAYGVRDCIDGTSNTIAFGESIAGSGTNSVSAYRGNTVTGVGDGLNLVDATTNPAGLLANFQECNANWQAATTSSGSNLGTNAGWHWCEGAETITLFNTLVPPNSTQYPWNACRWGCGGCPVGFNSDHSNVTKASSFHPGGVNMLMADGSVRFIKSTVAMRTYWALGTRANGEVISADQY